MSTLLISTQELLMSTQTAYKVSDSARTFRSFSNSTCLTRKRLPIIKLIIRRFYKDAQKESLRYILQRYSYTAMS